MRVNSYTLSALRQRFGTLLARHFKDYRRNALARGIQLLITLEEFAEIVSKNCYYCGARPKRLKRVDRHYSGEKILITSEEKMNGVDRLDCSKPYVLSNLVPACKRCNQGKNDLSPRKYIEHCKRVAKFRR